MEQLHEQALHQLVFAVHPLPDDDWQEFLSRWKPISVNRRAVLTVPGKQEKFLYFVTEGVQRVYSLDDADREATIIFTYAPSFGGVIDSLLLQQPSRYYYEALTPSAFLQISQTDLLELAEQRPALNTFIRKALTHSMSGLLQRLAELQSLPAEQRFRNLLQRSPHILQLVPQKYLANYLGMDATNFSKLMNTVRI